MKKNNLTAFLSASLIAAIALAIFFAIKTSKLETQVRNTDQLRSQLEKELNAELAYKNTDSLLLEGSYRAALNALEEQSNTSDFQDVRGIEMRMALANELLRLRYEKQMADLRNSQLQLVDSSGIETAATQTILEQNDSLSFALEKARVQLKCLKRQLTEKSFGEYLTFTNRKGSKMHYVGQIVKGKANGFGFALLSTGGRYEGLWQDNQRHGEGTYYWDDGQYYKGEFVEDRRSGYGTYYWPNGEKYIGYWKDDKRSGEGTFYGKDGEVVASGVWKEDLLTDQTSVASAK